MTADEEKAARVFYSPVRLDRGATAMLVKMKLEEDGSYSVVDAETGDACIVRLEEEEALCLYKMVNRASAREHLRHALAREAEKRAAQGAPGAPPGAASGEEVR